MLLTGRVESPATTETQQAFLLIDNSDQTRITLVRRDAMRIQKLNNNTIFREKNSRIELASIQETDFQTMNTYRLEKCNICTAKINLLQWRWML